MALVDLATSRALLAIRRQQQTARPGHVVARWLARVIAGVDLMALLGWLVGFWPLSPFLRAGAFVSLALALVWLVVDLYQRQRWSELPVLPLLTEEVLQRNDVNLADYLDQSAASLLDRVWTDAAGQPITSSLIFLIAIVSPITQPLLVRLGIPIDAESQATYRQRLGGGAASRLGPLLRQAAQTALADHRQHVDVGDLLVALAGDELLAGLFFDLHVAASTVAAVAAWQRRLDAFHRETPLYDRPVTAGIGQDWTAGYTPALNQFSVSLTNQVDPSAPPIALGRSEELDQLDRYLSKSRGHNVLIVGETGVGKQTLILGFAQRLAAGLVSSSLRFQHVRMLDLGSLLAGISARGDLEYRLLRVFSEAAAAGNVIVYVPEIQSLIGGGDRVGGVDATDVVIRILQIPTLHIIASTSPADYQNRITANPKLTGLLDRLELEPLDQTTTLEVLEEAVFALEKDTDTFFIYAALQEIVAAADRYLHDQPFPDKALQLMSEVANYARSHQQTWIDPGLVRAALSEKLKMPLQAVSGQEQEQLLHLEDQLHQSVIGQDEAIDAIASALRRARAGLATGKRPIGSLLFLGPTGVGKTESAKALARVYFGDENRMIRLDMSEYQSADGLEKLVGTTSQETRTKSGGFLADAVHDQPFSLILLDELEKASPQILNLFLQILDDGRLTDGTGRLIDFTNTIIIATSNAGAELIRQSIARGDEEEVRRQQLLEYLQQAHIYRPEFLNRFDGVVAFRPLTLEQVREIVQLMLAETSRQLIRDKQITVHFSDDLVDGLARKGFSPEFGARPIRRLIQDTVDSWLAQQILTNQLGRGMSVTIRAVDVGLAEVASGEIAATG